jgi:hypothetical protein
VVASNRAAIAKFLRAQYGDAIAVEMEGRGFLQAIHANRNINALVVRGISDLLGAKAQADEAGYQESAAQVASVFAFEVLAHLESKLAEESGQYVLVLSATLDDVDRARAEAIVSHLRELAKDARLTLVRIEQGSVRLVLEGTRAGFERLQALQRTGELAQRLGFVVTSVGWHVTLPQRDSAVGVLDAPISIRSADEEQAARLLAGEREKMRNLHRKNRGKDIMPALLIFNPSHYWRKGHVSVPWQLIESQTGISPQEVVLRDESGNELPVQVDRVDPNNPQRDILTFSLIHEVPPGPDDYSTPSASISVERGAPSRRPQDSRAVVQKDPGGCDRVVGLVSNPLKVWFNLLPAATDPKQDWYAGSATSVQLGSLEMLDAFRSFAVGWEGHDPEERAMQIAELHLVNNSTRVQCGQVTLFDKPYELIAHSSGPVRATVTIASSPFQCACGHVPHQAGETRWRLYRVLSLYTGANYLIEELYLERVPNAGATKGDDHSFTIRYFSYLDLGHDAELHRFPYIEDWFAVGSRYLPCPGYGFAVDVHSTDPQRDGLPNPNKCFTWQTLRACSAQCLHLFTLSRWGLTQGQPGHFDCQTGHAWYELIFKKLIARLQP